MTKRFVPPGLVMLAVIVLLFLTKDARDDVSGLVVLISPVLYVLACAWWSFAAMLDRRRLLWRMLLIWAPLAIPLALLLWETPRPGFDEEGWGVLVLFGPTAMIGFASLCVSILAPFYGGIPKAEASKADSE